MSEVMFVVGIALGGGFGAMSRFALDAWLRRRAPEFPWGTVAINVTGSFLLGLVLAGAAARSLPAAAVTVIAAGLLGGYTTFSTASQETVALLQERRVLVATAHCLGTLIVGVAAAGLGWFLGSG